MLSARYVKMNEDEVYHDIEVDSQENCVGELSPFEPLFTVTVVETAKSGSSIAFVLNVVKEEDGKEVKCKRDFEDIEFLHECLSNHNDDDGHIIPPLPPKPESDARNAELKSKRRYGVESKLVMPDFFQAVCGNVQRYLRALTHHSMYGTHPALITFLTGYQLPTRTKVVKTWAHRLSSAVDVAWKYSHKDIDEYFVERRLWATQYSAALQASDAAFTKLTDSEIRLSSAYSEFEKEILSDEGSETLHQLQISQISIKLAEAMEDLKHGLVTISESNDQTLGCELDYYSRYMDNVKEVLFKRTSLLIDYENANKVLEKCKPAKREEAEAAKDKAESVYDKCTAILRKELQQFDQTRLLDFRSVMVKMAEAQIKTARDTYAFLLKTTNDVKNL